MARRCQLQPQFGVLFTALPISSFYYLSGFYFDFYSTQSFSEGEESRFDEYGPGLHTPRQDLRSGSSAPGSNGMIGSNKGPACQVE